jgi:hypothetical protein
LCQSSARSVIRLQGRQYESSGPDLLNHVRLAPVAIAEILSRIAAELALFAGAGFLLFAVNDSPST